MDGPPAGGTPSAEGIPMEEKVSFLLSISLDKQRNGQQTN
jgi:hypothetical protein